MAFHTLKTMTCALVLLAAGCATAPAPTGKYAEIKSPGAHRDHAGAYRTDVVEVRLAAAKDPAKGHEIEYMVKMKAGDSLTYAWEAPAAGDFWHEFHGHTADKVTFYKKASGTVHQGSLVAPFDGEHGWYFENRTPNPVTVKVKVSGFYELVPAVAK